MTQPDCGETALQIVDELARTQMVQLIAIDSVSALVPRSEIDGEIGALQVGGGAGPCWRLAAGAGPKKVVQS